MTRPVETLAHELQESLHEMCDLITGVGSDLELRPVPEYASVTYKDLYSRLLKAADAAWKIHESLEKGESA